LPVKEKGITKKNFRGATMYHGIPLAKKIIFALIFAGILGTASTVPKNIVIAPKYMDGSDN
jgi:hypothetical protein